MMIGARLNWLLSHGKGKQWGPPGSKKFIQIDIEPREMDSNVEIAAPLVGDIGSCVAALLRVMGDDWKQPPVEWTQAINAKKETNIARMASRLGKNSIPMDYHSALRVLRDVIKERPDAILVNEGANTLDQARGVIDMYQPRKRLDVGTWGVMEIGMGFAIGAVIETGKQVLAIEGDSAFGFSGMEVETTWLRPAGLHRNNARRRHPRGTDVNLSGGNRRGHDGVRQGRPLRQDDRGVRRSWRQRDHATPDELKRAVDAAMDSGKPTLINAVIDLGGGQRERQHRQSSTRKSALSKKGGAQDVQGTRRSTLDFTHVHRARPARNCWRGSAPT